MGTDSLLAEIELVTLADEVFTQLNLSTTTKINNRKILQGIAQWLCVDAEGFIPFTITLDKLDKIGLEDVLSSFKEAGWSITI